MHLTIAHSPPYNTLRKAMRTFSGCCTVGCEAIISQQVFPGHMLHVSPVRFAFQLCREQIKPEKELQPTNLLSTRGFPLPLTFQLRHRRNQPKRELQTPSLQYRRPRPPLPPPWQAAHIQSVQSDPIPSGGGPPSPTGCEEA